MARKPRLFALGVLYHVIVGGNQRQKAFLKHSDYEVFLEKLAQYRVSRYEQKMPNQPELGRDVERLLNLFRYLGPVSLGNLAIWPASRRPHHLPSQLQLMF